MKNESPYKYRHEEDAYYTHQPVLMKALKISTGDVLELGCGDGSTELIHRFCEVHDRKIVTAESDSAWLSKYKDKFSSEKHSFILTDKWGEFSKKMSERRWGLVFIDQGNWQGRAESFLALRDCADYLILHDCDYFYENGLLGSPNEPHWKDVIANSKEFQPIKRLCWTDPPLRKLTGPPTLLASNIHSCEIHVDFSLKEESL